MFADHDGIMKTNILGHNDLVLMKLMEESMGRCSYPPLINYIVEKYGGFIPRMAGFFLKTKSDDLVMWKGKSYDFTTPPSF